jgi:hypothetical protein
VTEPTTGQTRKGIMSKSRKRGKSTPTGKAGKPPATAKALQPLASGPMTMNGEPVSNIDDKDRPIRIGSIVCIDGPEYGRVIDLRYGTAFVRIFDFEKPESQRIVDWHCDECTVVDDIHNVTDSPAQITGIGKFATAVLKIWNRIDNIRAELACARSAITQDDPAYDSFGEVIEALDNCACPLTNAMNGDLSSDELNHDLVDALKADGRS